MNKFNMRLSVAVSSVRLNLVGVGILLATSSASAATRYVWQNSPSPEPPYTSWATAARVIQDAIDAATAGDEVIVTNGIYATGGRAVQGTMTNRVAVDKQLTLRSVNGPEYTVIQGYQVPGTTNGDGAIRCVYLTNDASLVGFTLTNGATRRNGYLEEQIGGGLWCESTNAVASNCVITCNSAFSSGGGVVSGRLIACELSGNSATAPEAYGSAADGGGAVRSTLSNCTVRDNSATGDGGGAFDSTLDNCTLKDNSAGSSGGGVYGGALTNCTLMDNSAGSYGGGAAGGPPAHTCQVDNCILTGNSAYSGGAASQAVLNNCALSGNSALYGGGEGWSTLTNCTVTGNRAQRIGGGAFAGIAANCIIYFNVAGIDPNYSSKGAPLTLDHCCTTPQPADGLGNFSLDPQLVNSWRLSSASPCRGAGLGAYTTGTDIDGEFWATPPSVGCDEYRPGTSAGALSVAITAGFTNVAAGYPVDFAALIQGGASASVWEFGDGARATNQPFTTHTWEVPGDYVVTLRGFDEEHPDGLGATVVVHVATQPVHYVCTESTGPSPPYESWATAAVSIQDAVDIAAVPGALVLVTNGTYAAGGRATYGAMTNRVAVDKPLIVQSVNGPQVTIIHGYQVPGVTNGDGAIRCVYLANGASLAGFTLTNGATHAAGDWYSERAGGGVWCESSETIVSNCVMTGNSASLYAGGAYSGSLRNCVLIENHAAYGAGAALAALDNCAVATNAALSYGGGAYSSVLKDCTVSGNLASSYGGGGAYDSSLTNCLLIGNSADYGGGAAESELNNCTLSGNTASQGGGAAVSTLLRCSLSRNSAWDGGGAAGGSLDGCSLEHNAATNNGGGVGIWSGYFVWSHPTLKDCTLTANSGHNGGGVAGGTLLNCTLDQNSATSDGGGAYGCTLTNCIVIANRAANNGGGACGSGPLSGVVVNPSELIPITLMNCALVGNSARTGGAVYAGELTNCTLTGNSAIVKGGGASLSALNNCIIFFNYAAPPEANYTLDTSLDYCCTTPLPWTGAGNIDQDPQLATAWRLSASSPCRGMGNPAYAIGTDLDGEPWANPPSAGCDEYHPQAISGPLSVSIEASYTNFAVGYPALFSAVVDGRPMVTVWDFGDGTLAVNEPFATHTWTAAGDYVVRLWAFNEDHLEGVNASMTVHVVAGLHYVAPNSPGPVPPFTSWATAATTIQHAVDVALPGATVFVTNGIYADGGRAVYGTMTNRVAIDGPFLVRSVNGPEVTVIQGWQVPGTTNGDGAVRCVYLTNGAALCGFTLRNGATRTNGDPFLEQNGGGLWCESGSATVSNCVVTANCAIGTGGGAFKGTLQDCSLTANSASSGGGAASCTLTSCALIGNSADYSGGGASGGTLTNCVVSTNSASYGGGAGYSSLFNCTLAGNAALEGGGAYGGELFHSLLAGNLATYSGGGACGWPFWVDRRNRSYQPVTLSNCRITGNLAADGGGVYGGTLTGCLVINNSATSRGGGAFGGVIPGDNHSPPLQVPARLNECTLIDNMAAVGGGIHEGDLTNCIIYFNTATNGPNYFNSTLSYSCTVPQPTNGFGNITNSPFFVDPASGNFRPQNNSPCINAGLNVGVSSPSDLDGNPRIVSGTVDIGAYEYQGPGSMISYAWLQQYGFPIDGSADSVDTDADGHTNWQEWRCLTDPANALSALRLISALPTENGVIVTWESVPGVTYVVERSTNASNFSTIATYIVAEQNTIDYTDNTPPAAPSVFYRVAVGH